MTRTGDDEGASLLYAALDPGEELIWWGRPRLGTAALLYALQDVSALQPHEPPQSGVTAMCAAAALAGVSCAGPLLAASLVVQALVAGEPALLTGLCVIAPLLPVSFFLLRGQLRRLLQLFAARYALTDRGRRLAAIGGHLHAWGASPPAEVQPDLTRFQDGVVFVCPDVPAEQQGAALAGQERVVWEATPGGLRGVLAAVCGPTPGPFELVLPFLVVPGLGYLCGVLIMGLTLLGGLGAMQWAQMTGGDGGQTAQAVLQAASAVMPLAMPLLFTIGYLLRGQLRIRRLRYQVTDRGRGLIHAQGAVHAFTLPAAERIVVGQGWLAGVVRFPLEPTAGDRGWPATNYPLVLFYGLRDPWAARQAIVEARERTGA